MNTNIDLLESKINEAIQFADNGDPLKDANVDHYDYITYIKILRSQIKSLKKESVNYKGD